MCVCVAFFKCSSISNITIPKNNIKIGSYVFSKCKLLVKNYVKNSVENVQVPAAKAKKPYSSSIYSTEAKSTTDDINENTGSNKIITGTCGDNVNFKLNKDTKELFIYGSGKMIDLEEWDESPWNDYKNDIYTVVIRNGVTSIGNRAFNDCFMVTSVSIPASATTLQPQQN